MAADDTVAHRSPLDKPLYLLTEDDISQVTREDCRRYLKSKGHLSPSPSLFPPPTTTKESIEVISEGLMSSVQA